MIACPCGDTAGPFVRTPNGVRCEDCAEKKVAR
ncbi:hypothetical protein J3A78_002342 [Streptomyces sp. PvR006]|nr:hypothetical protein [Streptomyces sp. PvR006]